MKPNPPSTLAINGHIIFTETTVPAPPADEYSRWISTGQGYGYPSEYSIQRFTYKAGGRPREGHVKVPPYYRVYNFGFTIADREGNEEFDTFEAACNCADQSRTDTGASS